MGSCVNQDLDVTDNFKLWVLLFYWIFGDAEFDHLKVGHHAILDCSGYAGTWHM